LNQFHFKTNIFSYSTANSSQVISPLFDDYNEHDAQQYVAHIAEHIVEGSKWTGLDHAQKVKITRVFVSRFGQLLEQRRRKKPVKYGKLNNCVYKRKL
jgi:hypothetical protein